MRIKVIEKSKTRLHISSRDISFIAKKARAKKDKEEEKKRQTSITSKAYKLFTKGKSLSICCHNIRY